MSATTDMESAAVHWAEQVQPHCEEKVIAACPFARQHNEIGRRAAARSFGLLGWAAENLIAKKRAAGLPNTFVLAVTPTKVRAYESRYRRGGLDIGEEVAVWERAGLEIESQHNGVKTRVKIRSADGDDLTCSAGTHEYTDRFIGLMADPDATL